MSFKSELRDKNTNSLRIDFKRGTFLANPSFGDEVVISGLSGSFPNAENVQELKTALFQKVDLTSPATLRYQIHRSDVPSSLGLLKNLDKFDAGYFGIHYRQATTLHPTLRILLEKTIEAVLDAGLHPSDLEGSKTGVFIGFLCLKSERNFSAKHLEPEQCFLTENSYTTLANRISYFLKLNGPSFTLDSGCSSSLVAVEEAFCALRSNLCDTAIVAGTQLSLEYLDTLGFARMGTLSSSGKCSPFDTDANGYVRSEAVVVILLQRANIAKRNYAQIVHVKSNCDGFKEQGITFPSRHQQASLLKEIYKECGIDPIFITYLEAHGTGTLVGDPEEIAGLDNAFHRKRDKPLLVGSIKSNMGHTEAAAGMCGITKALIAFESGFIPPNIHFTKPNTELESIVKGRISVVTEKVKIVDKEALIAVNSFGFGGVNAHCILRRNSKEKKNNGIPEDGLPRLVCVSGRTQEAVRSLLNDFDSRELDAEHASLLHEIFRKDIHDHYYRGFSITSTSGKIIDSCKYLSQKKFPLLFVFGSLGHTWKNVAKDLFIVPVFLESFKKINNFLITKGLDLLEILEKDITFNSETVDIVGGLAVQIGIVDILQSLGLQTDGVFGRNLGEVVCAFFDGTLTLEQIVSLTFEMATQFNGNSFVNQNLQYANYETKEYQNEADSFLLSNPEGKIFEREFDCLKNGLRSAELFRKAFAASSNLYRFTKQVSVKSIVLEIGSVNTLPLSNLGNHSKTFNFALENYKNYFIKFLDILGRLYECGYNPQLTCLYPKIEYPVSRGTPMIAPHIKWNHSNNWFSSITKTVSTNFIEKHKAISFAFDDWKFVKSHIIDGKNLFPSAGYLYIVWEIFRESIGLNQIDAPVRFEDCQLRKDIKITSNILELVVRIQTATGQFCIMHNSAFIMTGNILLLSNNSDNFVSLPEITDNRFVDSIFLNSEDIYKELRLRGYDYRDQFRVIEKCDVDVNKGYIKWDKNWVVFIENMLKLNVLQIDSRLNYVPSVIQSLIIHPKRHKEFADNIGENASMPVDIYKDNNVIRCGGVQLKGIVEKAVFRSNRTTSPVLLEKYVFVPNRTELTVEESIRVNLQLAFENYYSFRPKIVEIVNEENVSENYVYMAPLFNDVLKDLLHVHAEITVFSKTAIDLPNINVKITNFEKNTDSFLVSGNGLFQKKEVLNLALKSLKNQKCYILSRENLKFDPHTTDLLGLDILTSHTVKNEKIILARPNANLALPKVIKISSEDDVFDWVETLKISMKFDTNIILYAQNEPLSGLLGLINCMRKEPGGTKIRAVLINDNNAPNFDVSHPMYQKQLRKNMAVNIYQDFEWGTYRHLILEESFEAQKKHSYVKLLTGSDLSSLSWVEGPLNLNTSQSVENRQVYIYYTALNSKDILSATDRLTSPSNMKRLNKIDTSLGFEFSGRDKKGVRVFGLVRGNGIATMVNADKLLVWKVPDDWTLEDAATVGTAYSTVLYALLIRGKIKKGESILIHCGAGGVGQAAIRTALFYACKVYTTVETEEKKLFIKKQFPQLTDSHIGNSRNTSFESMINKSTNSRGVDLVLNSLSGKQLFEASVRCLAYGGRFLQIEKIDLIDNSRFSLKMFKNDFTFYGIMLDNLMFESTLAEKKLISEIIQNGIQSGLILPLNRVVFQKDEVENAFRYMVQVKHKGKVLLQIREEEHGKVVVPNVEMLRCLPRYNCDRKKSYIILGGLGGFGLELADWLVDRGAEKLILNSRTGIRTGYQKYRINFWTLRGANIVISTADATQKSGCKQLINEASSLGSVDAVFNLAVVLKDGDFENQTVDTFKTPFQPKALATYYIDKLSRIMCPDLRDFVVFSSINCGKGNAAQTNYGMCSSVAEKICEQRKNSGFPATAIQWGPVGDVGLVAKMQKNHKEIEINGMLQQGILSCLEKLDTLLTQKSSTIVSSSIIAPKNTRVGTIETLADTVLGILGFKKECLSFNCSLSEMGMDSITAAQIKRTMEQDFNIYLMLKEIRNLTYNRLEEIQNSRKSPTENE